MDQPEALNTFLGLTGPEAPARKSSELMTGSYSSSFSLASPVPSHLLATGGTRGPHRETENRGRRDREESEQLERLGGEGA